MGFLKTLSKAFVEEVPNENEEMITDTYSLEEESSVEVELDDVNTETLIDDVYTQNDLYDKSKSIFKVEELINTLPKEMVTETKRISVVSALGIFGLTATQVTEDGETRIEVLNGVKEKINSESSISITDKVNKIEELKKAIADLEVEIANEQNEVKVSNESITNEVNRINELIKFVGGTN